MTPLFPTVTMTTPDSSTLMKKLLVSVVKRLKRVKKGPKLRQGKATIKAMIKSRSIFSSQPKPYTDSSYKGRIFKNVKKCSKIAPFSIIFYQKLDKNLVRKTYNSLLDLML